MKLSVANIPMYQPEARKVLFYFEYLYTKLQERKTLYYILKLSSKEAVTSSPC